MDLQELTKSYDMTGKTVVITGGAGVLGGELSCALVGCNAIGWTEHVGVMRGLVEGAVRLGPWKARLMADPTLLMEAYLDRAQAQGSHAHVKAA